MVYVIRRMAEFVGNINQSSCNDIIVLLDCDPCDLVLVPNVTTAMNCVLQSLAKTMSVGDVITFFNITYGEFIV